MRAEFLRNESRAFLQRQTDFEERDMGHVARFIFPSIADIFFLVLFWALLAGGLSSRPLADADIGWHIRTGQKIIDTRSIPHVDSFSSTMEGKPWFAWEWLYDVAVGSLERAFGLNGVVWLCALIIATTFACVFRTIIVRGTNLYIAALLALLAVSASTIHFFARPHIVSWIFVWLWFFLLDRWERGAPRRAIYWLPALMVLWVNLHGGFVLGLAVMACFWFGAAIEAFTTSNAFDRVLARERTRMLGIVFFLSVTATLFNPYGYQLHIHIYRYLTNRFLMTHINEFASPDFHGAAQKCFAAIVLVSVMTLARSSAKLRISNLLILLLAVYAGLYASRNLPVASILLVMVIGPPLSEVATNAWRQMNMSRLSQSSFLSHATAVEGQLRGHLWPILSVFATFTILSVGGKLWSQTFINAHFDASKLPVEATRVIASSRSRDPIFCPDSWGGFLIYQLSPEMKVVVDDRHDLYGETFLRKYLDLVHVRPGWNQLLDEWKVRRVLMPTGSALDNILRESSEWHITHEDRTAVLFERSVRE